MILEIIITVLMCSALVGAYCHQINSKRISKLEKKLKKQKRRERKVSNMVSCYLEEMEEIEEDEFPEPFKVKSSAN